MIHIPRKISIIILSLLSIVAGIFLIINPDITLIIIARIIGGILLLTGIALAVHTLRLEQFTGMNLPITGGLILIIFGIIIVALPGFFVSFLPVIIGTAITVNGLAVTVRTIQTRHMMDRGWILPLLLGIIAAVLGVMILVNPFESATVPVIVIGIIMVYNGISNILYAISQQS